MGIHKCCYPAWFVQFKWFTFYCYRCYCLIWTNKSLSINSFRDKMFSLDISWQILNPWRLQVFQASGHPDPNCGCRQDIVSDRARRSSRRFSAAPWPSGPYAAVWRRCWRMLRQLRSPAAERRRARSGRGRWVDGRRWTSYHCRPADVADSSGTMNWRSSVSGSVRPTLHAVNNDTSSPDTI